MLVCLHVPFDQQINSTNYLSLHYIIFVPYNLKAISSLRHRGNQTVLVKSVCKTAPKSLFWVPTCVPGFEYLPGSREFETHFRQPAETVKGPEQGCQCCLKDVTKRG